MLVGEQPGDHEDLVGRPFMGPAGKLLRNLIKELGISSDQIYVTNAVKHFKWTRSGKRRLHQRPNSTEIEACHPWLEQEISLVSPKVILCLGATAVRSVLQKTLPIGENRRKSFQVDEILVLVTWHPSSALRVRDAAEREERLKQIKADLLRAWKRAKQ